LFYDFYESYYIGLRDYRNDFENAITFSEKKYLSYQKLCNGVKTWELEWIQLNYEVSELYKLKKSSEIVEQIEKIQSRIICSFGTSFKT